MSAPKTDLGSGDVKKINRKSVNKPAEGAVRRFPNIKIKMRQIPTVRVAAIT